jgi:hypothetical protein
MNELRLERNDHQRCQYRDRRYPWRQRSFIQQLHFNFGGLRLALLWLPTRDSLTQTETLTFAAAGGVPEPSTWAMMLIGFAGLGFAFRQSRRKVSFA